MHDEEKEKDDVLESLGGEVDDYRASKMPQIHIHLHGADAHPVAQPDKENEAEEQKDEYSSFLDKMSGK